MNIIYNNGTDFIKDNYQIISNNQLETIFFVENAKKIKSIDKNNYMIKIYNNFSYLLAIHCQNYPLVLFGDLKLVDELILVLNKNNYHFDKILTSKNLGEIFLQSYEKINGGFHYINLSMDIMKCDTDNNIDNKGLKCAKDLDVEEITKIMLAFYKETANNEVSYQETLKRVKENISDFVIIKNEKRIVSIAKKTRETEYLCSISAVYTLEKDRKKGFSKKIVSFLTNHIVNNHKMAYLFVDKNNPISNHLYQTIGYAYDKPQFEFIYKKIHNFSE